jgi:hypothetical protein
MPSLLMPHSPTVPSSSRATVWVGRALFALAVLFMVFDTTMKFLATPEAVAGTEALGWPTGAVRPLGVIEAGCVLLLLIPRTAPLGALFLTGYLGGAVATHVRVQNPLFTHILFPVYIAVLVWLPLYLRDPRVRAVLGPLTSERSRQAA